VSALQDIADKIIHNTTKGKNMPTVLFISVLFLLGVGCGVQRIKTCFFIKYSVHICIVIVHFSKLRFL